MGLFPPWSSFIKMPKEGIEAKRFEGYSFITIKPKILKSKYAKGVIASKDRNAAKTLVRRYGSLRIDLVRLLIQWALVIFTTGGAIFSLNPKSRSNKLGDEKIVIDQKTNEGISRQDGSDSQFH